MPDDKEKQYIGAAWTPTDRSKTYLCRGEVTINGWTQRFFLFPVEHKKSPKHPDFSLVSYDEPFEKPPF